MNCRVSAEAEAFFNCYKNQKKESGKISPKAMTDRHGSCTIRAEKKLPVIFKQEDEPES